MYVCMYVCSQTEITKKKKKLQKRKKVIRQRINNRNKYISSVCKQVSK